MVAGDRCRDRGRGHRARDRGIDPRPGSRGSSRGVAVGLIYAIGVNREIQQQAGAEPEDPDEQPRGTGGATHYTDRAHGLWRSLVSALDWGSRGREFKSPQPDSEGAGQGPAVGARLDCQLLRGARLVPKGAESERRRKPGRVRERFADGLNARVERDPTTESMRLICSTRGRRRTSLGQRLGR